jgi:hypothetical protein
MTSPHLTDEQLSAHLDGVLAAEELAAATDHIAGCADCASRSDLLRATSQAVATLPAEEMPRPLDLGFLRETTRPAPAEAAEPGFFARILRGRPPVWLPTAVAAAAVLVLAVNVGPRLQPAGGGASQTSAGLGDKSARGTDRNAFAPLSPETQNTNPALAAPYSTTQGSGDLATDHAARKAVTGPDGSAITLVANPPGASTGRPTQLVLMLVGGPAGTSLAPGGMQLFVSQGSSSMRIAGSLGAGQQVQAHQELDITAEWSAGAAQGPPAPGSYTLVGRVSLADGRVVEVSLPFTVSPG